MCRCFCQAAVVPDSYAGVFPVGSQGPLVYNYGFCSSGFLSDPLYQKCMNQELTLQDINMEFIANTPSVPTSFIQVVLRNRHHFSIYLSSIYLTSYYGGLYS